MGHKIIKTIFFIGILCLINTRALSAESLFSVEGSFCKANNKSSLDIKDYLIPAWSKEDTPRANNNPTPALVQELDSISHQLNQYYLSNIKDSFYFRLAMAKSAGLPVDSYKQALEYSQKACDLPDSSGKNFSKEIYNLKQVPARVEMDFKRYNIFPDQDSTLRRILIAGLEKNLDCRP